MQAGNALLGLVVALLYLAALYGQVRDQWLVLLPMLAWSLLLGLVLSEFGKPDRGIVHVEGIRM